MAWRQHLYFTPVTFVRQKEEGRTYQDTDSKPKNKFQGGSDGKETKSFYEEVVGLNTACSSITSYGSDTEKSSPKKGNKKTSHYESDALMKEKPEAKTKDKYSFSSNSDSVDKTSKKIPALLKSAQLGKLADVQRLLQFGVDMNATDQYGWTALMCAAKSGHKHIVEFLLSSGANRYIREKSGRSVLDILEKDTSDIYDLIMNWDSSPSEPDDECSSGAGTSAKFFCSDCNAVFSDETDHGSSTLHLFNLKIQPKSTAYMIPESNPGFKMMLRSGWDQEKGLGPEGHGQKFPIKTVLKRDRQGLGGKLNSRAKVSHFGPKDVAAVKMAKKRVERKSTLSKKSSTSKHKKDRKKEINFRRDFYDFG